ncbi:hypothetical protein HHK36_025004 [Tetracentron sinense]|uniref:Uncharacterized protein n=1 Tax=Tetracentron sinense TaxID=13715 RepID=A0A835D4S7_TETSI|nr:hypothetical protein HHK36_025004 [Tetracentron sinense]
MGGFPAKMAAATLAVFLLLGGVPVISALLPSGNEKGLWWFSGCRGGWRKADPGNGGSFGCGSREKIVSFGRPRWSRLEPPPPPRKNQQTSSRDQAPPPESI